MTRNRCEVHATALDEAGCGVGNVEGIGEVHVADLLPGEGADVQIDHASPHAPRAWGHVTRRLGPPSRDRVEPGCPAFGRCGGCAWQHLAYPAQLTAKRERVATALAALPAEQIAAVRASPQLTGYRNKGKYVAGRGSGGHIVLGAFAPRSHDLVDTIGCRTVAPVIDEVASWVRGAVERSAVPPYDEATRSGSLRYAIIRESGNEVLVALVVTSRTPRADLERIANTLASHPAMRGIVAIHNDRRDGAIIPSGATAQVLLGHGYLFEELSGARVEVGAGEFLQVNRAQAAAMYARVAELADARPGLVAIDLFAGLGGIGLALARAGAAVTSVEIDREAVAQLRRAAERAGLAVTALAGDAATPPAQLPASPDVVVVNPPRKGLSPGALGLVATLAPRTLVYVSCGPESLARDLATLGERGYTPDTIEPFDLMPGTAQVETLVRLQRS